MSTSEPSPLSSWLPVLIVLAGPLLLIGFSAWFGPEFLWVVFGVPFLLGLWALTSIWTVWFSVRSFRRRAWRGVVSGGVLPVAVLCAAISPFQFIRSCEQLGDLLSFQLLRASYRARVAALPNDGQPKPAVFTRGGWIWHFEGIVYDETDEVMLPAAERSSAWTKRAGHSELTCNVRVRPLGDHFYLGYFDC